MLPFVNNWLTACPAWKNEYWKELRPGFFCSSGNLTLRTLKLSKRNVESRKSSQNVSFWFLMRSCSVTKISVRHFWWHFVSWIEKSQCNSSEDDIECSSSTSNNCQYYADCDNTDGSFPCTFRLRLHVCWAWAKCLKKGDSWIVSMSALKTLQYHISPVFEKSRYLDGMYSGCCYECHHVRKDIPRQLQNTEGGKVSFGRIPRHLLQNHKPDWDWNAEKVLPLYSAIYIAMTIKLVLAPCDSL